MDISTQILSDITVYMKYAKYNPDLERRESWEELVTRNKQMHQKKFPTLKKEIESAYKLVYDKKVLPSMRSMQFAGKPIEISPNRIYNCAYLPIDDWRAFSETMFLLLGGTGVGYSVQKHHVEQLPEIRKPNLSPLAILHASTDRDSLCNNRTIALVALLCARFRKRRYISC